MRGWQGERRRAARQAEQRRHVQELAAVREETTAEAQRLQAQMAGDLATAEAANIDIARFAVRDLSRGAGLIGHRARRPAFAATLAQGSGGARRPP